MHALPVYATEPTPCRWPSSEPDVVVVTSGACVESIADRLRAAETPCVAFGASAAAALGALDIAPVAECRPEVAALIHRLQEFVR